MSLLSFVQDQLLFCDDCDRGYHMYCLSPAMAEPPEGESRIMDLSVHDIPLGTICLSNRGYLSQSF